MPQFIIALFLLVFCSSTIFSKAPYDFTLGYYYKTLSVDDLGLKNIPLHNATLAVAFDKKHRVHFSVGHSFQKKELDQPITLIEDGRSRDTLTGLNATQVRVAYSYNILHSVKPLDLLWHLGASYVSLRESDSGFNGFGFHTKLELAYFLLPSISINPAIGLESVNYSRSVIDGEEGELVNDFNQSDVFYTLGLSVSL